MPAQDFKQIVTGRMNALGMTTYQLMTILEEKHGIGRTTLYKWMAGEREPSLKNFQTICSILGLVLVGNGKIKSR